MCASGGRRLLISDTSAISMCPWTCPFEAAHILVHLLSIQQVEVTTEDGNPLPTDAAAAGLCVKLRAPSAEAAAAARGDADADGANGGSGCVVVLRPLPPDPEASQASRGLWCFALPGELTAAGEYSVTAEYTETRQELARWGRGCGQCEYRFCLLGSAERRKQTQGNTVRAVLSQARTGWGTRAHLLLLLRLLMRCSGQRPSGIDTWALTGSTLTYRD